MAAAKGENQSVFAWREDNSVNDGKSLQHERKLLTVGFSTAPPGLGWTCFSPDQLD